MEYKKWPNKTLFNWGRDDHGQDLGYFRNMEGARELFFRGARELAPILKAKITLVLKMIWEDV